MKKPMLSVIVPVFNVEQYLQRCLNSVCSQDYDNLEIICVDDGSTDNSGTILDNYAIKDNRIRVIHKKNGGLVSARKAGILVAKGKYATYVDSDDWIEQGMYSVLMSMIEDYDADVVTSGDIRDYNGHVIVDSEKVTPGFYEGEKLSKLKENLINTTFFFEANISTHIYDKIYKRDLLENYQSRVDDRITLSEDAAVIYPLIFDSNRVVVSGYNFYHYCIREGSICSANGPEEKRNMEICIRYLENTFKNSNINNAMNQFSAIFLHMKLMRDASETITYDDTILYPYGKIKVGEKLVIYGAGKFGTILLQRLRNELGFNVVAVVDKKGGDGIAFPDELETIQYDKILVAILKAAVVRETCQELKNLGISDESIITISL